MSAPYRKSPEQLYRAKVVKAAQKEARARNEPIDSILKKWGAMPFLWRACKENIVRCPHCHSLERYWSKSVVKVRA